MVNVQHILCHAVHQSHLHPMCLMFQGKIAILSLSDNLRSAHIEREGEGLIVYLQEVKSILLHGTDIIVVPYFYLFCTGAGQ